MMKGFSEGVKPFSPLLEGRAGRGRRHACAERRWQSRLKRRLFFALLTFVLLIQLLRLLCIFCSSSSLAETIPSPGNQQHSR